MTDPEPHLPRKHAILLVDDEPEILFSLKGLLRREFELYTAESGPEALEILEKHPIHVVMTDQRMPQMTGVELMGRVRSEHPEAIRIIFTGYADIKAVIEALNSGGLFRYITKPWDPDELLETLRQAAAHHDHLVQRRTIFSDARDHIAHGRQLTQQLASQPNRVNAETVEQFQQDADQMIARLTDALEP